MEVRYSEVMQGHTDDVGFYSEVMQGHPDDVGKIVISD
jgi:hypothetical protein